VKSYEESFKELSGLVEIIGEPRPTVDKPPRHDSDPPGPSIFRLLLEDVALADLRLPGLYVGRSELRRISFRGSDLHLSAINWNDVLECDFRGTDLSGADLRSTRFARCNFSKADLSRADLRGAEFDGCTFEDAVMRGAILHSRPKFLGFISTGFDQRELPLSPTQRAEVVWSTETPEPGGG
jgi:pentapeptide repeat protein